MHASHACTRAIPPTPTRAQWFTYSYWNAAQAAALEAVRPGARPWSINRAFQPGMQRFAATTWTGDGQDCSHAKLLSFAVAGQPYFACDMTSPDATVLVRQYAAATFMPTDRVHQMHGTPRFPFLWGGPEHQAGFRAALNLRYALIPLLYSLAHTARRTGALLAGPASYVLGVHDPAFPPAIGDATYMVGDTLLPAAVSSASGYDPNEVRRGGRAAISARVVVLSAGAPLCGRAHTTPTPRPAHPRARAPPPARARGRTRPWSTSRRACGSRSTPRPRWSARSPG